MMVAKQLVTNEQDYLIITEQEINTPDKVVDGWSGPDISPPRALGNAVISTCVVQWGGVVVETMQIMSTITSYIDCGCIKNYSVFTRLT